ncbi:NAD(P)H-binding protein [Curtobacterium sp. MCJR17_020]|uniref:NmrA family NAD(P)-binding protein n=1 Tax=Curtobacterium sp. MCJR17_020 TaxID=2175619 RepID=UPI000DA81DC0|nr:NAD(P)H-binding protein [Curtobacterium sp. MCJR17_020]WIE73927.1 NAD(P)H-binding protein [Curtobacterium sp. MCJR17_020]
MIVVTAPTGLIGSQVLAGLLEGDEPVRVIVRDASRLSAELRDRVEVIEGSHRDAAVVDRAFAGADSVFWLVPADERALSVYQAYVGFSIPAADAIVRHGVKRVVTVSALGRGTQIYAGYASASNAMEDLIASTGVHLRALVMPSFVDNLIWQVGAMKNAGAFFSPIGGDLKLPAVATRDIAAEATRLLLSPTWTGREDVPVLGPEDLSFNDMAAIITDVLGTPIRFQQVPAQQQKDGFLGRGYSEAMAAGMVDMAVAKDNGLDNAVARTRENTTPTTFREWVEDTLKPAFTA